MIMGVAAALTTIATRSGIHRLAEVIVAFRPSAGQ
jgi:hypothetical protein